MDGVLISRNFQISLSNILYYFSKDAIFVKWFCFMVHWDTFKSHSFQEIKMFSLHLVLLYISQFGNPQVANISAHSPADHDAYADDNRVSIFADTNTVANSLQWKSRLNAKCNLKV